MNADGVRAVLWIRRRVVSLPRFTFLEWLVAMQTTFGTFATRSRHVLNRRVLMRTNDVALVGLCALRDVDSPSTIGAEKVGRSFPPNGGWQVIAQAE